jgi:hypothetical protein
MLMMLLVSSRRVKGDDSSTRYSEYIKQRMNEGDGSNAFGFDMVGDGRLRSSSLVSRTTHGERFVAQQTTVHSAISHQYLP